MNLITAIFDLGIFTKDNKCLSLIELKMWSMFSKNQLDRQIAFLKTEKIPGLHILLGTADLQFFRDPQYDEIADLTDNFSQKIGYS